MSIFVNKDTKVLVQGITGNEGSFHTRQCMAYGTRIVAGVTPGRGGQKFQDTVPVYDTVLEAVKEQGANTSVIFVPPFGAAGAIMEAADAGCKLIVCITEGVPTVDMVKVMPYLEERGVRLIGHHETGGHASDYEAELDEAFALYEALGVRQVKTGYVADGGDLRRVVHHVVMATRPDAVDDNDTGGEQRLEKPADDHRVGDVGDLHLVEAQKPGGGGYLLRDRCQRIVYAGLAGLVQLRMHLLHEGVEVHPTFLLDGDRGTAGAA